MRRFLPVSLLLLVVALITASAPAAQSALVDAVERGDADAVRAAIAAGDDVDADYPLLIAAQRGDVEIIRLLLNAGADPSVTDEGYRGSPDRSVPETLLQDRLDGSNEPAVALALDLIEQLGSAADEPSVLDAAARWGRADVVARLLNLGADAAASLSGDGWDGPHSHTPLHSAMAPPLSLDTLGHSYAPTGVVRLLLDAGADPNAYAENFSREPGSAYRFGSTPLQDAAWEGRFAELAELLTHGADAALLTNPHEDSSVPPMTALELARARLAGLDAETSRFDGEVPFDYYFPTAEDLDAVITLLE